METKVILFFKKRQKACGSLLNQKLLVDTNQKNSNLEMEFVPAENEELGLSSNKPSLNPTFIPQDVKFFLKRIF